MHMKDWDTGPEINLSYPPRMSDPKTRTEDKDNNRCKTQYEGKAKNDSRKNGYQRRDKNKEGYRTFPTEDGPQRQQSSYGLTPI